MVTLLQVGLDLQSITKQVVANIHIPTERIFDDTAEDRTKIKAVEWLCFDPLQRFEALYQANALARTLLVTWSQPLASDGNDYFLLRSLRGGVSWTL